MLRPASVKGLSSQAPPPQPPEKPREGGCGGKRRLPGALGSLWGLWGLSLHAPASSGCLRFASHPEELGPWDLILTSNPNLLRLSPAKPVQAVPGSIVNSLLWPRQRAGHEGHPPSAFPWRSCCPILELQEGPEPALLASPTGQAVPHGTRKPVPGSFFQPWPRSPHTLPQLWVAALCPWASHFLLLNLICKLEWGEVAAEA